MMFMMHIALLYGLMVLAGGFITFHFARRFPSTPLKIAAWILVIGGAGNLLCTGYSGMRYWQQGYFDRPMMMPPAAVAPLM
jgi:hypothetical protein